MGAETAATVLSTVPGKSTARQWKRLPLNSDTSGDIAYHELDSAVN